MAGPAGPGQAAIADCLGPPRRFAWRMIHRLLSWCVLVISLGQVAPAVLAAEAPARRPNILFILTDDQRADALGVVQREQADKARFPWLRTPHLDGLAAGGVRFRNAFVVNSLCSPSRASMLTGKYSHCNGIANNHTAFPADAVTVASLLRQAGYATGYIGKWHMGPQRGKRPGFDYSASFVGQGKYVDCPFEIDGQKTATSGWVDDVSTGYAEAYLRQHREQPFFLMVGFKSCHQPFTPPARHAATYTGERARPVPNLTSRAAYAELQERAAPTAAADADGLVPVKLDYFRTITAMDENVGRLLKVLDELKLTEDTIVIFAGDNGYYLGEHQLGDKRSAYEESMRIPLIIRYPRAGKPAALDPLALNVDIPATILDFAGVPAPADIQGRSLRPWVAGEAPQDWRKAFFYSYFYERSAITPSVTAVRTTTGKLIKYPGHDGWTEYFDLQADPYETRNLATAPEASALRAELDAEYAAQSAAVKFTIPAFADKPSPDGTRKLKRRQKNQKADPADPDE